LAIAKGTREWFLIIVLNVNLKQIRKLRRGKRGKGMLKCELCGLETEKMLPFKEGECPKGIQHKFRKVVLE